jgi:protein-tyrosine phosphatase
MRVDNAVTGTWGGRSQKMLEWLLHREAVHVIASDAHDPVYRQPVLSGARDIVSQLAGSSVADALVNRNPAAIIEGRPVPYQPMLR